MNLWMTADRSRFFLISSNKSLVEGNFCIKTLTGRETFVDPVSIEANEIPEAQARQWAKDQLGEALGEIRGSIDEKLADWRTQLDALNRTPVAENTTITPNAAPALLDLLKQLPSILGNSLSGDEHRVDEAKNTMTDLQRRLKDSGIDHDDRLTKFPSRFAELRKEVEREWAAKKSTVKEPQTTEPIQVLKELLNEPKSDPEKDLGDELVKHGS